MKIFRILLMLALLVPAISTRLHAQTFTLLHSFTNSPDGENPYAGLIISGNTLYGTTYYGGTNGDGTVFAMATNGTGFTILHGFTNSPDGDSPYAGLILCNNTLYGTTYYGGTNGFGAVFAMATNGTSFTILHSFSGSATDGKYPYAGLTSSGGTLYGTTTEGGTNNGGTVFAMATNGTGFTILRSFTNAPDATYPQAGLILSSNILYGTAADGGSNGAGIVFAIATNGSGYTILHNFTNAPDGASPSTALVLSGNMLYGTTWAGGTNHNGTVFSLATNGTDFAILHSFNSFTSDGITPQAGLILSGNMLYGTTLNGGTNHDGTVFAIATDGTDFTILHSISGPTGDGLFPYAGLVLSGNTLYGTTYYGGTNNDGTVFSFVLRLPPVPFISGVNLAGTNLVINVAAQNAGTYEILACTNVVLPLNQWTPVATNILGGSGTFNTTNAMNPNAPNLFFRAIAQ